MTASLHFISPSLHSISRTLHLPLGKTILGEIHTSTRLNVMHGIACFSSQSGFLKKIQNPARLDCMSKTLDFSSQGILVKRIQSFFTFHTSETLHFPSKELLLKYLEQHPLTKDPFLKEKGIIQAIAEFFANEKIVSLGVDVGVINTLSDLDEKLKLPWLTVTKIGENISRALKNYPQEKSPITSSP